jgi:short-subunit dehydrogenase
MGFWGKIAVVTGAGSGIGAALSNELARRGARVVRTDIQAQSGVRELDVTQPEAVEALVSATFEREGGVDYRVNNAGIGLGGATGLSMALRAEAKSHGVRVSVACPGAIETAIWERSDVRGSLAGQRARLLSLMPPRMSAERCAVAIVRGVEDNRGVIPISFEARVAWWLSRVSPALASSVSAGLASFARSHRHRGASS